jgi:hypothetical protein
MNHTGSDSHAPSSLTAQLATDDDRARVGNGRKLNRNTSKEAAMRPIAVLTAAPKVVEVPVSQGRFWANAQGVHGVVPLRHGFSGQQRDGSH